MLLVLMSDKSVQISIGGRIRERREKLGLSQEELAKKLGYKSRSSINKIELDQRNLTQSKIKAFADALGTTPGFIMGWEPDDASRIRMAREVSGFTQKKLAQQIGVSVATLDAWERGYAKPRKADFDALAAALDMSPYSLYDWDTANDALASYMNDMVADHGPHIFDLINHFDQLNDLGQTTAVQRVAELTEIDKYKAELTDDRPHDDDPI